MTAYPVDADPARTASSEHRGSSLTRAGLPASSRWLALVIGALLLSVLIVPTAWSKLESQWASAHGFSLVSGDRACAATGYCFRVVGRVERFGVASEIPLQIEGADNVYDLARDLDEGRLRVIGDAAAGSPELHIRFARYFANEEVARRVGAALRFDPLPTGRIAVAFEHRGATSPPLVLEVSTRELGPVESVLARTDPIRLRLALTLLVILIAVGTGLIETRAADR